ncbi:hypothetical protein [Pelosinus propionicus]|uniref:Uncharacterized protein n=1 Tax=Pelosinus propionicus DSM 13327 TaxID=1123291 RepID=A0A1I4JU38_9FIRM|nr:hypothetical protein [Pelosinus propionicus]SFL70095.1 hypothetical protein SAMN04490355_101425 [Pelosinus propionicus DSM 13327]
MLISLIAQYIDMIMATLNQWVNYRLSWGYDYAINDLPWGKLKADWYEDED